MKNYDNKTILLVGGGTGGHAAPIYAIYDHLHKKRKDLNLIIVGAGTSEEKKFFAGIDGYRIIKSGRINTLFSLKFFIEASKFLLGVFQAFLFLNKTKPAVVFSKGGYASLPVIYAARALKIPYFFHESDISMGKVNRIVANKAKGIYVNFPKNQFNYIDQSKTICSGPVLKDGFFTAKIADKSLFGFSDNKPIILITGGSQGSLNISLNFIKKGEDLLKDYNVIHQAGKHSIKEARAFYGKLDDGLKKGYYLTDFLGMVDDKDLMIEAINICSIVVSRASSTIAELAIKEKPMILIPWKFSAQDHQLKNALFMKQKNAAIVINENDLTPEELENTIRELSPEKIKTLTENAKNIFPQNGTEIICDQLLKEIEG